jgi:hypothetical protein
LGGHALGFGDHPRSLDGGFGVGRSLVGGHSRGFGGHSRGFGGHSLGKKHKNISGDIACPHFRPRVPG